MPNATESKPEKNSPASSDAGPFFVHDPRFQTKSLSRSSRDSTHLFALSLAGVAHAQGTMDFSGAQTLMGTFKSVTTYADVRAGFEARIASGEFQLVPGQEHGSGRVLTTAETIRGERESGSSSWSARA